MAESCGFFNAVESGGTYDRTYDATDFAKFFRTFAGDGVFIEPTDQLKVIPKSGMTVTLKAGNAYIEGYWYELDEDMDFTISANTGTNTTYNLITITLDKSQRKIYARKKEGLSNDIPTNNESIHDLVVASILLRQETTTITSSEIVDRRALENYCGFVTATFKHIDVEKLYTQYESEFNDWLDSLKEQLNENAAANLQNQINALPTIHYGTSVPDDSVGKDGDIYIKI